MYTSGCFIILTVLCLGVGGGVGTWVAEVWGDRCGCQDEEAVH